MSRSQRVVDVFVHLALAAGLVLGLASAGHAADYAGPADEIWMADLVTQMAEEADVPFAIAHAVVFVESRYQPTKRGKAGEIGLMQLKCSTAKFYGFAGACDELTVPTVNLTYGLMHLRDALIRGAGFHQAGINARGVSDAYVERVRKAMKVIPR